MKLVIAEKPSVAGEIAKVLGASKKEKGYYSGNNYYVSWCLGHLIESSDPEDYNPDYKNWSLNDLPIIPDVWKTKIVASTSAQYTVLRNLVTAADVSELICATDAGREGELIFRLVYDKIGNKKPFKRLWISSNEEKSIRDGFDNLKDSSEYDNLYQAALARMKADWYVGINATRLYSKLYNKSLSIGRVQTPTINLIVDRQHSIDNFTPAPYYVLTANCGSFKAYTKVNDLASAEKIKERCNNKSAYITKISKEDKQEAAAPLFDLTTLQREANKLFGLTAQQTLDIAQSLYDQKLLTYPRTDSRYITADMEKSTHELINELITASYVDTMTLKYYSIDNIYVEKIINDKKVTDHHALLPTKTALKNNIIDTLNESQKSVLLLVMYRLLTAVYSPFKYTLTTVLIDVEGEAFKTSGKQVIDMGFKEIQENMLAFLKATNETDEKDIPETETLPNDLQENQLIEKITITSEAKKTQPPKPYTEATLLAAMENAGRLISDEALQAAIKGCGLGTPATRAGIIEKIVHTGFIERQKKNLIPTEKAIILMELIPDKIKSPELTAEWEFKLEKISSGELSNKEYIADIVTYIKELVTSSKLLDTDNIQDLFRIEKEVIGVCPRCGKNVYENAKSFYCDGYKDNPKCTFSIWKNDKFFESKGKTVTKDMATKFLKGEKVLVKKLKKKEGDGTYDANIFLVDTLTYVNFKMEFLTTKNK